MDGDQDACVSSGDSSEILDCLKLINATNDYYPTLKLPVHMVALYGVVYSSIFLTAVVGNIMVVAVVMRTPRMQTVTNLFIVNLAVLDILVAIFCIPVTFLDNIYYGWPFGYFLCKVVPYIQGVCVCASVYNLGAIAMDRFLAVCAHSKWRIMKRGAIVILCFIWVFSFAVQTPWAIFYQHWAHVTSSEIFYICAGIWPDFNSQRAFFVLAIFVGTYLLPLSFVFLCYMLIAWHVWHRRPPGVALGSQMIQRCRNKVIMMLITVVLMFALSWLPLHVLFLVMYFDPPSDQVVLQRINDIGVPLAQLLELSNTGMNVFIYSLFSGNFRRGLKQLWHLLPLNRKSAAGNPISTRRSMSENSTLLARSRSVKILFSHRCDGTRHVCPDNGQSVKPPYLSHVFRESVVSLENVSKTDPV